MYEEVVEGYDPKGMGDRMSLIEEQTGLKFGRWKDMSALTEEMKLRDPKWLLDGTVPKPSYESEEARAFKNKNKQARKQHADELRTAERISVFGFDTTFIIDEIEGENKGDTIGLADLKSGLELKTLDKAARFSTIDGHIDSASNKNAKGLLLDNYDNELLSDEKLKEWILKSRRFKRGPVYIYGHDGKVIKTR